MISYREVRMIWELDFSKLVTETYGRPYSLQQQDPMLGQNEIIEVTVPDHPSVADPEQHFAEWLGREVEASPDVLWWHREFYPELQVVLNDLRVRGLIEPGEYVIHAWW